MLKLPEIVVFLFKQDQCIMAEKDAFVLSNSLERTKKTCIGNSVLPKINETSLNYKMLGLKTYIWL